MHPLIDEIEQRNPAGIAAALGRLVTTGRVHPGDRLPTVREIAAELGVSPATVSQAWRAAGAAGLIVSRGRGGTFVRGPRQDWLPARSQVMAGRDLPARIDLSRGTPDPDLLPALGPALARVSERAVTSSYQDLPVIPELLSVLESSWPYRAEALTVVNGALDAISRSLEQIARFSDRIIVESPTFPPFLDLLEQLGLAAVPVAVDAHGPVPRSFAAALLQSPVAAVLQPRAHNPTGASMTEDRAREIALLLRDSPTASGMIVIEDDHSGQISLADDVSLGRWIPDRVLHVRSYSKSHGPDLRIAALGGPTRIIDRIVARRMLGPGWTSRMLQTILHELLVDETSIAQVSAARAEYARRQRELSSALARIGVTSPAADGINTWLAVDDEQDAILQLAASGIRVAGGTPFLPRNAFQPAHIRVTAGAIRENASPIADAIGSAMRSSANGVHTLAARWA